MRGVIVVAILAMAGCSDGVDREAMRKARQAIELCDNLMAKGQTTLQTCLDMRKRYEEQFGRKY